MILPKKSGLKRIRDSDTKSAEESTEEPDDAIDIEKEWEKRLEPKKSAKKAEIDAAASLKSAGKKQAKTVLAAKEEVDIQQEIVNSITAKEDIEDITNEDRR
jgi:ABC-type molybdate transport system substrate-binding protein